MQSAIEYAAIPTINLTPLFLVTSPLTNSSQSDTLQIKPLHARTWPQMTWVDLDSSLMYIGLLFSVLIQVGTKNKSFKKEKYVRRKSRNFYWYNN